MALGAGGGALGSAIGSAGGKFISWVGKKAASQLEGGITGRVASLLGKYAQRKKDAVAAMKNLKIQDALERAPAVGNQAASPAGKQLNRLKALFPGAEADLYGASGSNAAKQVRRFVGSQNRFGQSAMPPLDYAERLALRNMMSQKTAAIKGLLGVGARVAVGSGIGGAVGAALDEPGRVGNAYGGALLGGAGGLYVARKLATNVMTHPKLLSLMGRRLPALGRKMSAAGGDAGAVAGYLTALFATKQGRDALKDSVSEFETMPDAADVQPQGGEYDASQFEKNEGVGRDARRQPTGGLL
jgi:hypothetical protein